MSILENLFARSPFSLLQSHMEKVATCVQKLEDLFDAYLNKDYELIEKKADEICKLEHIADLTKNDIRNNLPKGLFMAISRGDLLEILSIQDSIADAAEDIGVLFTLKKLKLLDSVKDDFKNFLDENVKAVERVHQIIRELDELLQTSFGGKEADKVQQMVYDVAYIEHEIDVMQRKLLKKFYNLDDSLDYSSFDLWINIVHTVASLSDNSENLANKIAMLLVKS